MPISDTYESSFNDQPDLRHRVGRVRRRWLFLALTVIVAIPIVWITVAMWPSDASDTTGSSSQTALFESLLAATSTSTPGPFVQDDRLIRDLSLALTELAIGTADSEIDAIFGHPSLLTAVLGPQGMSEESIVIFVNENIHEDSFTTEQPDVWLRVDGSDRLTPTGSRTTRSDIHHRTVRFEWDVAGLSPLSQLIKEDHRLILLIDPVSTGNTLVWDLPIRFSSTVNAAITEMESSIPPSVVSGGNSGIDPEATSAGTEMSPAGVLRRTASGASYGGVDGIQVSATFATENYLDTSFPAGAVYAYMPDGQAVFVFSESTRVEILPADAPKLILNLDGTQYEPDLSEHMVSSDHNRITVFRFPTPLVELAPGSEMSLVLPDGKAMVWIVPNVPNSAK